MKGLAASASAGWLARPSIVKAETYPLKPIIMINPYLPGGYTDNLGRVIAPRLAKVLGQPITVVNMPGGDGMLGHQYYLGQPSDGYTLLVSGGNVIGMNILARHAPFKRDDFQMINLPARDYTLMATNVDNTKLGSLADVVALLKKDPSSLSIGTQSASPDLINLAVLTNAIGVKLTDLRMVTFEGGQPVRSAILGDVIDVGFAGGEGFLPFADQVRPLLTFDNQPQPPFKSPTVKDANVGGSLDDFVPGSLRGFVVSTKFKESYPDRYATLVSAYEKVFKDPETIAAMEKQQLASGWYGPDDSNAIYDRTYDQMAKHLDLLKGS